MLSVNYAECCKKPLMLSINMLKVVMLSVVIIECRYAEWHYAECRDAVINAAKL